MVFFSGVFTTALFLVRDAEEQQQEQAGADDLCRVYATMRARRGATAELKN